MDMLIMLTGSVPQRVGEFDHPPRALSTAYVAATRCLTRTVDSKPASIHLSRSHPEIIHQLSVSFVGLCKCTKLCNQRKRNRIRDALDLSSRMWAEPRVNYLWNRLSG